MIHKVKSVIQAVSVSLGEGAGFGLSLLDGQLYVGDPESLEKAGVKTIHMPAKGEINKREKPENCDGCILAGLNPVSKLCIYCEDACEV